MTKRGPLVFPVRRRGCRPRGSGLRPDGRLRRYSLKPMPGKYPQDRARETESGRRSLGGRAAPGEVHPLGGQPTLQVVVVSGQAVDGADHPSYRLLADLGRQQAVPNRIQQFVDVGQVQPDVGANLEIEVMVFGTPHSRTWRVFADVEVVVMVAFVTGAEVKDRRPQPQ